MTTNLKDRYKEQMLAGQKEFGNGWDYKSGVLGYEAGFSAALDLVQADIEQLITATEHELSQIKYRDLSDNGKLVKEALAKFKGKV